MYFVGGAAMASSVSLPVGFVAKVATGGLWCMRAALDDKILIFRFRVSGPGTLSCAWLDFFACWWSSTVARFWTHSAMLFVEPVLHMLGASMLLVNSVHYARPVRP